MTTTVEAAGVGVAYRLPRIETRSLKALPAAIFSPRIRHERLWALREVTFALGHGETLAIVGPNGAGKSTLLRLLAGIFRPTTGRVVVRGAVAAIIDLGSGFELEANGSENVELYGALLGRSPSEMRRRSPEILEWAGLSDFATVPLAAYSTGMRARLAFSIAVATEPDVLLIDEVLAVGDAEFQQRSSARISELIGAGSTVVVVSHALEELRVMCSRALWLDSGRVRRDGAVDAVVDEYIAVATT